MKALLRPTAKQAALFILFIIGIICALAITCQAQTLPKSTPITINAGSNGYVTINGNNYKRGDLRSVYRLADSTIAIIYSVDRMTMVNFTRDTFFIYGDSTNKVVRNYGALKTWFNTNFEYRGN